jgi:hypothetical protein
MGPWVPGAQREEREHTGCSLRKVLPHARVPRCRRDAARLRVDGRSGHLLLGPRPGRRAQQRRRSPARRGGRGSPRRGPGGSRHRLRRARRRRRARGGPHRRPTRRPHRPAGDGGVHRRQLQLVRRRRRRRGRPGTGAGERGVDGVVRPHAGRGRARHRHRPAGGAGEHRTAPDLRRRRRPGACRRGERSRGRRPARHVDRSRYARSGGPAHADGGGVDPAGLHQPHPVGGDDTRRGVRA